mmetsp:Transcript_22133/g.52606  ORF Transcript_22133/g.52606 Transcript_22133/m.52606 type:complete len:204 (-) Transcript_22133:321-932(-)
MPQSRELRRQGQRPHHQRRDTDNERLPRNVQLQQRRLHDAQEEVPDEHQVAQDRCNPVDSDDHVHHFPGAPGPAGGQRDQLSHAVGIRVPRAAHQDHQRGVRKNGAQRQHEDAGDDACGLQHEGQRQTSGAHGRGDQREDRRAQRALLEEGEVALREANSLFADRIQCLQVQLVPAALAHVLLDKPRDHRLHGSREVQPKPLP